MTKTTIGLSDELAAYVHEHGTREPAVLARLRARVGQRVALVSVGGIETAAEAAVRLDAGATLVQAYTGFVYGGPGWPARVTRELAASRRMGP